MLTPAVASQLPLFHIVGFTGHRQIANPQLIGRAIDDALDFLKRETLGEWVVLSSVAEGGDQLFVRQALQRGMSWHAILPLPHTEFARDFTPEQWKEVQALLLKAEHLQISNDDEGLRDDAYLDCGMETVNGSDLLLAVWDGEAARGRGGTAEVIEYARSVSKPILIIDANTGERRVENWGALNTREPELMSLNRLPDARTWGENPFQAPDEVFAFQQKCDYAATKSAPGVRRMTVSTVLVHVLATMIAAASLAYGLHLASLAWTKLLCLGSGVAVALVLRRRVHSERSWVKCRLAAEFCRSALATWGLPRATNLLQDLDLPVVHHLARSLRILHGRAAAVHPVPIAEFQRIYREQRIEDQLKYYRRQEAARAAHAAPAAPGVLAGHRHGHGVRHHLCADAQRPCACAGLAAGHGVRLPAHLPAGGGRGDHLGHLHQRPAAARGALPRHAATLEASRAQISYCSTWNSLERVVLRTERALLQEVIEWHSLASFSESH